MSPRERVEAYYADLLRGDAEAIAAHFTPDAVHYCTRRDPDVGSEVIGRAYYGERGGDLRGFDHAARGHAVLAS